jgi:hypothetical protein
MHWNKARWEKGSETTTQIILPLYIRTMQWRRIGDVEIIPLILTLTFNGGECSPSRLCCFTPRCSVQWAHDAGLAEQQDQTWKVKKKMPALAGNRTLRLLTRGLSVAAGTLKCPTQFKASSWHASTFLSRYLDMVRQTTDEDPIRPTACTARIVWNCKQETASYRYEYTLRMICELRWHVSWAVLWRYNKKRLENFV